MNTTESSTGELNDSLEGQTHGAEANSKDAKDKQMASDSEVFTLRDKVSLLEMQLKDSKIQLLNVKSTSIEYQNLYNVVCSEVRNTKNCIVKLNEMVCNAKSRADIAEANSKDKRIPSGSEVPASRDKVYLLENQRKDSEIHIRNVKSSSNKYRIYIM